MADEGFTVETEGLEFLIEDMSRLPYKLQAKMAAVLKRQLTEVLNKAKDLAPYESGDLADSGRLNGPRITGGSVYFSIDFGVDPPLIRAIIQHENLTFKHPGGKQAKYVETPLTEWASQGPIAAAIEAARDIKSG
jgi:hypothetical protein